MEKLPREPAAPLDKRPRSRQEFVAKMVTSIVNGNLGPLGDQRGKLIPQLIWRPSDSELIIIIDQN